MNSKFKIKKIQLSAVILLIFMFIISGYFVFSSISLKQAALALSGNYSKGTGENLDHTDWNTLAADFLDKSGDAMSGALNMNNNRIENIPDAPTADTDAVNRNYVDAEIAAASLSSSGGVYVNWGREDCCTGPENCPIGAVELYHGIGFSAHWENFSGGSNPICIEVLDPGGASGVNADELYPLVTASNNNSLPSDGTITAQRMVKCAVCQSPGSTCFVKYGSASCAAPFSALTEGYLLGSISSNSNANGAPHNSTQRRCVNKNFDAGLSTASQGAVWYGTKITNNYGSPHTEDAFIKCAVCCD